VKLIDIENIRLFVNGITQSLELAQHHLKHNNQCGIEVKIYNALEELAVLREELDKPDMIDTMGSRSDVSEM
jgi:hypothetical protein